MSIAIPSKLEADPIIDAIIEMRLDASVSLSDVLPGVLLQSFEGTLSIERLSASEIPKPIRDQDPNLKYQPLMRLVYGSYSILVGDRVVALSCPIPYPGGDEFKKKAIEVFSKILQLPFSVRLTRLSMKYVDFIEGQGLRELAPYLNLSLAINNDVVSSVSPYALRLEVAEGRIVHLINVAAPVDVSVNNAPQKKGALIDVDSILNISASSEQAIAQLQDLLNELHVANKKKFFALLTNEALEKLGAQYE